MKSCPSLLHLITKMVLSVWEALGLHCGCSYICCLYPSHLATKGVPGWANSSQRSFFFPGEKAYYLLWGITTLPEDRLNLSHLYCFIIDVPVNCSLGFKDFQKWISTESDSVNFFLRKLGFVQILPHLCSNNPDITFSLLSLSLISSRLLYHSTDMIYMLVKVTWIHRGLFCFLKILPNQGAQKSHWCFIQILRSLLN